MRYLSLLLLLLVVSCKDETPEGIMTKPEMVHALKTIYLDESRVNRLGLKYDSAIIVFNEIRSRSFDKAGIDDAVFKRSFDYYSDNPDMLDEIYGAVVDSLNLMEQQMSLPVE